MFSPLLTLVALFVSPAAVRASPCVAFDTTWNLLAFGLDGKDWNAGTQDTWASGTATDITTSGRPPFDGTNTTCFLSQYTNAIYVTNGDKSSPSSIHIYDATAKSWSTQAVTTGSFDPSSFNAILDHDTNVFYALSHGELFHLDMGLLKAANSTSLQWVDVEKAPYADGYQPVMALAQNHVFFLNVPGTPAGSADIYVIHFDYFQPDAQAFPTSNGVIPATYGQTASFFQDQGVQEAFAFIPSDSSATYVLNVQSNTTQTLAGPSTKDAGATYFAGINSLVQLDSKGGVSYLPFNPSGASANAAAQWSKVGSLAKAAPPSSSVSSSSSATSSSGTTKQSGSSNSSSSSSSSSPNGAAAVAPRGIVWAILGAAILGSGALLV
ncbi:hypothetical protein EDB92DRAFT_2111916 [Lactarius akahatsu]|uniref:Uncharacterized protein n=1 Tax=Lactarius akahatsu TaxID=416441 RepID=A0AAD4LPI8_9AGAM|nr:hypothetical protein EDB92DRAFT_2111916 [Lactarius akahatsu]